jgi:hypothetical protein
MEKGAFLQSMQWPIRINGIWYSTVGLAQGPPDWYLWDEEDDIEVPVPLELEQAIMEFVVKYET